MKSDTWATIKYDKRRIYRSEISFHSDRINDRENKEIKKTTVGVSAILYKCVAKVLSKVQNTCIFYSMSEEYGVMG